MAHDPPRDDVEWLARLLRDGLLVIVRGVERKYGLKPYDLPRRETVRTLRADDEVARTLTHWDKAE